MIPTSAFLYIYSDNIGKIIEDEKILVVKSPYKKRNKSKIWDSYTDNIMAKNNFLKLKKTTDIIINNNNRIYIMPKTNGVFMFTNKVKD
jgi:hypothetical protein